MNDYMPEALRELGPWGLAYWQWIGIGAALVFAVIAGRIGARALLWVIGKLTVRTEARWDDEALARLAKPTRFLGMLLIARLLLPLLELPASAHGFVVDVLLASSGVGVLWGLVRIVDVIASRLAVAGWAVKRPASRSLISIAARTVKVILVIIAAIAFLSALGLPVGSLIAGVGIGGVALAFGAKQTVENLFGAFALGIDQPLREGDFVRTDGDTLGTVEMVGLRSTRIRTLDRTVVSLPNGRLADSRIETFGERDRCRLHTMVNLVYSTTAAQVRDTIAGLERVLRDHPRTYRDEVIVKFHALGESSLQIEVMAWFDGPDFGEFRTWREDILLAFLEVVERAGTAFALPTRTLHLASLPKAPS